MYAIINKKTARSFSNEHYKMTGNRTSNLLVEKILKKQADEISKLPNIAKGAAAMASGKLLWAGTVID